MDEYIRKQNEKNKSAAMGGFEEVSREREAAYKTAEQKSGEGFAELLRQMYADDYRRRAETDASLEARGLNTGAGSQASLEQASTLRQNERDMRLAEESARLNIETSRNAAEAEARAAVQKAIASADYNAANQLYENFKSERSSAQRQVDKMLAAGVMPDDGTISKSGYDLDYVKGLYTKNTASRGGSGKSTFESIAEKAGQTIAAALKNPKGGNGSNKKGGTAATLILNNAMQKKDVNERQEYLLAAQAAGAITDKECGGMLLLTMQAPTFAKPKVTALQLGAIEGKEPIDRSEALKLKTAIFGNSPVALPTTVGEAKTMLTNAVVGSLAAEITARRKQSENMSAYLNAVYDDSAPTTSVQLKTQLDSGEITQDEIIARHAAAADYREKHFLTSTDGATVEDLFMQGYTEEQVDQYLTTRSKEQETADNEKAMSNVQPHSFLDYDSDVENVIAGILARGRALWNNFLGNISGEGETRNEHEAWLGLHPYDEEAQAEQEAAQQRKKQEYYNFADYLSSQSAAYLDAAKEGNGALGEFAVDAAVVLSDVATDAAANFLVPGSGIVLMGVRAYEQGRMNGRQNGLDDGEQILYGLSTAGIEITTEKLFGGLKIAYGKGVADKAAGKAIAKITERLAETSAGKAVSKFASSGTGKVIAAAFGEGMEEVIADLLQPGVDVAFGLSEEYEVHLEDIVYDGLLGGFVGLLGGGTNLAQNRLAQRAAETQTTYNTLAQGGVTAEQQWATMRSQDPSLSGALFSANNGAALMAEFERVKQGAKSGIAFAFNSIQQTGAVNTNEAAVTAAARSATEVGAVTESNSAASTAQAKSEPSAQEIAQAAAAIQASKAIITQAETALQEIEELHRNGSLSDESYKKRIRQIEKKIRKAERAANTAKSQLNIDNTVIHNYTESINDNVQGGLPNDGNRVDRGLAEEVPGGQYLGGNTQAGREWGSLQNGRGSQKLSRRDLTQSVKDVLKDSGVVAAELVDYSADSAAFSDALASARAVDGQNGWAVTPQSVDDLQGKKLFADANGTIGFAITPDGDIEAVFKNKVLNKTAHAMDGVMPQALALGGMKLDCYGDALVRVYERYGFTPVARVEFNPEYANEGWTIDKGTPYIYFMVHNGDSAETVAANIGKYSHMTLDELNALPTYAKDGYDEAYAYRDGLLQDSTVSPEYAAALEAEQQYREGFNEGVGTPRSGFGSVREQSPEMAAWYRMADEEGASGYHPLTENRLDTLQASQLAQGKTELREGIQVPKKDIFGGFTSQTVSNLVNSGITPDAVADSIMEDARTGKLSHIVITDHEAKLKAEADIKSLGWDKALEEFKADVEKGMTSKYIVTTGQVLYNNAVTAGDFKTALDITALLVKCSTNTAQALQAMSMLEKLSPDSRLYAAFKGIDTITKEIVKKYHLEEGITIDPSLISEYREALINGNNEAIRTAWGEIEKNIADQIPPSWRDKLNAWRYLAMLGNPRTHIRNILGNGGFAVVRLPKDVIATGLEYVGSAVSGGKMQRTKAFLNPATNVADRQLIATAWLDYANAQATIIGSGTKYKDLPNTIDEKRTIFTSKVGSVVEAASKGNTKLLNFEDRWFSQPAYTFALAGYLKANGISAAEYTSGDANPEVISKAQEYAIREAQKATYRDTNVVSQAISRMRVKPAPADASAGEKALRGVGTVLVEGILPYKKTPANILVRAAEYSPAGLTKYLIYGTVQLARGKMSAAHWIDGLSAGLTGTGLVALGVWLAAEGILMGGEPDDREKLQRYQGYSINLGGRSYTLDWLAPEALPVFVGVELYNQHKAGNGNNAWALIESMKNLAEPVTEMSMLQGVNDMLETVSYADDKLSAIAVQSAVSYISQFIPTLSGQIERITEDRRQTTFVDRNSETPTDVQRILGKLFNKLPGEYQQIDYVDAWGRTQETGNAFERLANNLLNPAYVNEIQVEKVEDELQRLTDLGESGMFPSRPAMSDQINGEYLTAEQYEKYTKTAGQLKLAVVSDLTSSEVYAKLSDADKAEVIRKAYTYANGVAKLEIDEDAEVASWIIKAKDYGNPSAFLLAKHTLSDIEYEKGEQGAKKEAIAKAINAMPLSRSEKSKLFELLYPTYKNDIEWR